MARPPEGERAPRCGHAAGTGVAVPGELDAHPQPIRISADGRRARAHPRFPDGRDLDRRCLAPARADDDAGPGRAALPGMTTLAIPSMMALDCPDGAADRLASTCSISLNGDSELIVMTAGGMPAWSLLQATRPAGAAGGRCRHLLRQPHGRPVGAAASSMELAVQVRTDLMSPGHRSPGASPRRSRISPCIFATARRTASCSA